MTDMIERVAMAIRLNLRSEGSCYRFADCYGLSKPFCECEQDVAVVALKAIREPTDEMVEAGENAFLDQELTDPEPASKFVFQAMIDTALKIEEKDET